MRSTLAIAKRILLQFAHDKRTLTLLFVAPVVVLWLLTMLLGAGDYVPRFATVDLPSSFQEQLMEQDVVVNDVSISEAEEMLSLNDVDAVLFMQDDSVLRIWVEGSDSTKTHASVAAVTAAISDSRKLASDQMQTDVDAKKVEIEDLRAQAEEKQQELRDSLDKLFAALPPSITSQLGDVESGLDTSIEFPDMDEFTFEMSEYLPVQDVEVSFLHGNDSWKAFDFYGPVFIGIFLFVFTFITSGMSLVNERSAGTMTRFLATPVRPIQILGGYSLGFGVLASVQSAVILWIALTFIGFPNEGNLALVVFTAVSLSLASVTLGLLVSGLASSAFQVIQLMLIFVMPQILLSGLFDLSSSPEWLQVLGQCLPLTYGVDALRGIMLRGSGLESIGIDLLVIWGFIALFFVLAALGFRKKRAKQRS